MSRTIVFSPGEKVPGTRWTVLSEAEKKNGERMYKCQCDCGTIKIVNAKNLKYGKSLSCGCLAKEKLEEVHRNNIKDKNKLDLTGNVFGQLKVLEKVSGIGCETRWKCECLACGKIFDTSQWALIGGNSRSCGCMISKRASERSRESFGHIDSTCVSLIASKKNYTSNTSGVRGVSYNKRLGKYSAYIIFKGKWYNLGYYVELEDAKKAREQAEEELFGNFLKWYYETHPDKKKKENE